MHTYTYSSVDANLSRCPLAQGVTQTLEYGKSTDEYESSNEKGAHSINLTSILDEPSLDDESRYQYSDTAHHIGDKV
jgi:hypothetical protein